MAWLLDDNLGEDATYCKLPDCGRLITIKSGEPTELRDSDGKLKSIVRGRYKTRKDTEFCKNRPCRQKYSYRKKAGWPGYT